MQSFEISQEGATEVTAEVKDDPQWIKRMTNVLNECQEKTQGNWPCTIFKVPEGIRQCDNTAYDPSVVTIGPYHYNKSEDRTVRVMQAHKWHCVRRLLSRHTKSRRKATDLFGQCLEEMRKMDADVRGSYSEDLHHLNVNDLALIMLLDGCFIIHVLLKFSEDEDWENISNMVTLGKNNDNDDGQEEEEEDIAAGHEEDMVVLDIMEEKQVDLRVVAVFNVWYAMLYDLVKVENQIPFTIIQTLFSQLKIPGDEGINLVEIASRLFILIHPSSQQSFAIDLPLQVHHLLQLFHSTLVPSNDCLEINKIDLQKQKSINFAWIPNATELQLAGVKFVKKGRAISFLDISFINGTIEIPQVVLDDNTNTLFRNLIAFEQCYYPHTENYITAYALFMDYMINTPKDVELFELKGIFVNFLGTPDMAATLINQLCEKILQSALDGFLQGSIHRLTIYSQSKWHKWRARLMRDYFDNPWAIVSLAAALILLLLTAQQSFFAVYSYFRPPKN